MEGSSSHGSSSFSLSKMQQFGVGNETDEISSSGLKGEPVESLNDVRIAGTDSKTKIGGCKSDPSPAERQRRRKHYEISKGYMEKIKKTYEKIADMEGALLEERDGTFDIIEYIGVELQRQKYETFAMVNLLKEAYKRDGKIAFKLKRLKEAQKERDGKIAFKLKRLKKELDRLKATGLHILGTNSESVDKFSSMELAVSHPISNGCANGADILAKLELDECSKVSLSHFTGLGGERIPVGKLNFPPSLYQIVKNITDC